MIWIKNSNVKKNKVKSNNLGALIVQSNVGKHKRRNELPSYMRTKYKGWYIPTSSSCSYCAFATTKDDNVLAQQPKTESCC